MGKKQKKPIVKKIPKTTTEVRGIVILAFSIMLFLSLVSFVKGQISHNLLGLIGHTLGFFFHALFGIGSYFICIFLFWFGLRLFLNKTINHLSLKLGYFALFLCSFCMWLTLVEEHITTFGNWLSLWFYPHAKEFGTHYHLGGALFYYLYMDVPFVNLHKIFNWMGSLLLFSSTLMASILFLTKVTPLKIVHFIKNLIPKKVEVVTDEAVEVLDKEPSPPSSTAMSDFMRYVKLRIPYQGAALENVENASEVRPQELLAIQPERKLRSRPSLSKKGEEEALEYAKIQPVISLEKKQEIVIEKKKEAPISSNITSYKLPPTTLLTQAKKVDQSSLRKDLKKQAEVLEETLLSFGIEAKVGQINCGPTITSFEVHPAIGVKVQKIRTLENDIALNMEAKSIRIIAPIPGKAAVGIEVPNAHPQEVGFKEMLSAYEQGAQKFRIPILLGKAVNGDYVMSDLTKMPHCIIAGATGSGKSVCINTIVMSVLLTAKPDEIKLIMVDPKKVELTPYTKLPHMLAPVITEPQGACAALNWLVKEMEKRYEILKLVGARNIEAFNARVVDEALESSLERDIPQKMPYIIGIIDELADLMMVASSDIETPIARIAQMARAVGIHLILATQRPSREVITGLIKANFPTRISFKVASRVNSQIILDEIGAESLLGNGDMLFLPPGTSHLTRAQGAFIRDEDIKNVVSYICEQAPVNYEIPSFDRYTSFENDLEEDTPKDSLYQDALDIVLGTGNASTTFLQRKLKLGYARAASLMDMLEQKGVVGPAEGSKPRKILMQKRASDQNRDEQFDD